MILLCSCTRWCRLRRYCRWCVSPYVFSCLGPFYTLQCSQPTHRNWSWSVCARLYNLSLFPLAVSLSRKCAKCFAEHDIQEPFSQRSSSLLKYKVMLFSTFCIKKKKLEEKELHIKKMKWGQWITLASFCPLSCVVLGICIFLALKSRPSTPSALFWFYTRICGPLLYPYLLTVVSSAFGG